MTDCKPNAPQRMAMESESDLLYGEYDLDLRQTLTLQGLGVIANVGCSNGVVKIGITAPSSVRVLRAELLKEPKSPKSGLEELRRSYYLRRARRSR